MAMANLPEKRRKNAIPMLSDSQIEVLVDRIAKGYTPTAIARQLAPHDARARKAWRHRLRHYMVHDDRIAHGISARARIELLAGLVPAMEALSRRARTGRPDAIKLLAEMSGFHNPRVSHEHSGEVTIKVEMPRPKFSSDEDITDAEVVEDA